MFLFGGFYRAGGAQQFKGCPHGTLGIVLVRARIAETGEHAVAEGAHYRATTAREGLGAGVINSAHHLFQVFRIQFGSDCREAQELAGQNRQLPTFGKLRLTLGTILIGREPCPGAAATL